MQSPKRKDSAARFFSALTSSTHCKPAHRRVNEMQPSQSAAAKASPKSGTVTSGQNPVTFCGPRAQAEEHPRRGAGAVLRALPVIVTCTDSIFVCLVAVRPLRPMYCCAGRLALRSLAAVQVGYRAQRGKGGWTRWPERELTAGSTECTLIL